MTAPPATERPVVLELPEAGTGQRAARRRQSNKRRVLRKIGFAVAMVVLICAIPVLATIGYRSLRDTTAGRRIDAQNDPTKPRYEADVVPTPVSLVVETGADGSLQGLTVLVLGNNDTGGAVVFIPVATVAPREDGTLGTLTSTLTTGDLPKLAQATANLMGLSFDQTIVMGPQQWQQFVNPVAPLTVNNPDRIVNVDSRGRSTTLFATGPLQLNADAVSTYLQARNPTESDLAHLNRKQVLWTAWLAAIKASAKPDAVPGETTSGIGRYLHGLAAGTADISTLPVKAQAPVGKDESFVADPAATAALVAREVPLPTPANPGDRTRVRLLSGTGPVGSPNVVAGKIVAAGGEVTILGNADNFNYADTLIIYYDDQFATAAAKLRDSLGLGQVQKSTTETDTEDITLILGRDATAKFGGTGG